MQFHGKVWKSTPTHKRLNRWSLNLAGKDPYIDTKYHYDPIRGFCSPSFACRGCCNAYKVTRLVFIVRLHVMQGTVLQGLSLRPSVCLSLKRVDADRMKGSSAHILIPHERSFIFSSDNKNGWRRTTLLPEILGKTDPVRAKTPIFNRCRLLVP